MCPSARSSQFFSKLGRSWLRLESDLSMTASAGKQGRSNRVETPSGEVRAGSPLPFGACQYEGGVNFALFSRHATRVLLELYESPDGCSPTRVIDLDPARHRTGDVWHVWVRGITSGQLYGFRIDGRSEEHTSELQSRLHLVCRLLLEKKKKTQKSNKIRRRPGSCSTSPWTGGGDWVPAVRTRGPSSCPQSLRCGVRADAACYAGRYST